MQTLKAMDDREEALAVVRAAVEFAVREVRANVGLSLMKKLYSAVLMMKSAEDRPRCYLAIPVDRPMDRRIFFQGQVRSSFVVIAGVGRKNLAQMGFAEDDDVIEAFSADRADQPFRVPVLPR